MSTARWAKLTLLTGMIVVMLGCPRPTPAALVKSAGDGLSGLVGQNVPEAPVVRVLDGNQRGLQGVEVHWSPGVGGAVGQDTTKTDADGRATCGSWTLGPARGINLLEVSVNGLAPVSFAAVGINGGSTVQVSIVAPSPGLVPSHMKVGANVTSPYSLSSVVASVEAATASLTAGEASMCGRYDYTCPRYGFGGTLDLSQQPRDVPVALFVTATDALGNVGEAAVVLTRNDPPSLTLTAPVDGALANPTVQIAASCSDDGPGGCVSLTASLLAGTERVELASGTTELMTQLDLSRWEGYAPQLDFEGTDELGQVTRVSRNVLINSSPGLTLRATVPGLALDVLGSRVLYLAGTQLRVVDKNAQTDVQLFDEPKFCPSPAPEFQGVECLSFLSPQGAVYLLGPETSRPGVYDWRNGTAQLVGEPGTLSGPARLQVEGSFAAFSSHDAGSGDDTLVVRDLDAGSNFEVSSVIVEGMDLSVGGDLVFITGRGPVQRWRAGTITTLSGPPATGTLDSYPVTDGNLAAWLACGLSSCSLGIHDGSSEQIIAPAVGTPPMVSNGWLAFSRNDSNATPQIWRRGAGGETQVTFFSTESLPEIVGPDGDILFIRRSTIDLGRDWDRFRSKVGAAPQSLGPQRGRSVLREGKLFILSGPSVIEIGP